MAGIFYVLLRHGNTDVEQILAYAENLKLLIHTQWAHSQHRFPAPSSRFGFATEGALFISAQLSSDTVSALQKVRVLI